MVITVWIVYCLTRTVSVFHSALLRREVATKCCRIPISNILEVMGPVYGCGSFLALLIYQCFTWLVHWTDRLCYCPIVLFKIILKFCWGSFSLHSVLIILIWKQYKTLTGARIPLSVSHLKWTQKIKDDSRDEAWLASWCVRVRESDPKHYASVMKALALTAIRLSVGWRRRRVVVGIRAWEIWG